MKLRVAHKKSRCLRANADGTHQTQPQHERARPGKQGSPAHSRETYLGWDISIGPSLHWPCADSTVERMLRMTVVET